MTPGLLTPSQTVGPFFLDCLLRADAKRHVLAASAPPSERIRIEGVVLDGDGVGVPDAMVEIWQADASGRYRGAPDGAAAIAAFSGYGRCATDQQGRFWFETVKPGAVAYDATRMQAPHVNVAVFARGLMNHLFTRIYFESDAAAGADPVLGFVPEDRRATLVARRAADTAVYTFDIVLQGPRETVFFDFVAPRPR